MQFDYTRSPSISTVPPSASLLPSPAHPGIPYIWRTYHPNVSPYIDSHGVTWVPLALRQSQPAHSPPLHYPNYTLAATPPSISQLFSTQPLPQLPYSTSPRFSEPIWANDLMRDQRRASELNIVEQIRQDQTSRRAGWKSVLEFVKESCPEGERELDIMQKYLSHPNGIFPGPSACSTCHQASQTILDIRKLEHLPRRTLLRLKTCCFVIIAIDGESVQDAHGIRMRVKSACMPCAMYKKKCAFARGDGWVKVEVPGSGSQKMGVKGMDAAGMRLTAMAETVQGAGMAVQVDNGSQQSDVVPEAMEVYEAPESVTARYLNLPSTPYPAIEAEIQMDDGGCKRRQGTEKDGGDGVGQIYCHAALPANRLIYRP